MTNNRVEEHWSSWQLEQDAKRHTVSRPSFVDWADHPTVWGLVSREVFGYLGARSVTSDFADLVTKVVHAIDQPRALSLCCGDGAFERHLIRIKVLASVDGVDLALSRVQAAQRYLAEEGLNQEQCKFFAADLNRLVLKPRSYDLVIAKSALHHVEALERLFEEIYWALKPDGRIVTIDFFGPSRFQWTDRQLELAEEFWRQEVPAEIRRQAQADGFAELHKPSVDAMKALDPSEAVRSAEIRSAALELFSIDLEIPLGGTVLNLILWGERVNYFDPANKLHNQCLAKAFELERRLMGEGAIDSDFRLIVLKPKPMDEVHA